MRNGHIPVAKMLSFDSLRHSSFEKSEASRRLNQCLHFRKEKWLQIKLVLSAFAFILFQPQECLSSHAVDDQGQARLYFTACQRACLANEVAVNFLTPHTFLSYPPSHLSSACDAVTSFPVSCRCIFITNSKRKCWKFSADCSSPYVPLGQCLSSTRAAQDFKISQQQQQMVEREKSQEKKQEHLSNVRPVLCS